MSNVTKQRAVAGQRQQSIAKTAQDVATRAWVRSMVQLSDYVPGTMRLAEWGFRSYKDKRRMRRFLGERSYISSRAQVDCPRSHAWPTLLYRRLRYDLRGPQSRRAGGIC